MAADDARRRHWRISVSAGLPHRGDGTTLATPVARPRRQSSVLEITVKGFRYVPGSAEIKQTMIWGKFRHRVSLLIDERTNSQFTGFLRLPTQFEALSHYVSAMRSDGSGSSRPLAIGVIGCSNGAEAFTTASVLLQRQPGLAFQVRGYDIEPAIVAKARTATYAAEEIFNNKIITSEFVDFTFDRVGQQYVVKPHISRCACFEVADALGAELSSRVGLCDIVFAQNFLFHLKRDRARRALDNIARLLRPGALLFADGVDLDLRTKFVRKRGFVPLDFQIGKIHDEARRARAVGWPTSYWGLEPLQRDRRDWKARYATIFRAP